MLYRTKNGIKRVENYTIRENYSEKQQRGLYIGIGVGAAVILLIIVLLIATKKKSRRR